jgi:3-hydroxyisobutyrate dehydrogenase-like beta-hydroxyacid dehydrogenase
MGFVLVSRLLERGCDVAVYNRTRAKAEPLQKLGARLVASPAELADRDIIIVSVAGSDDFAQVITGSDGLLASSDGHVPSLIIDSSTVSPEVSGAIRRQARERGVALLAAPVSGNPRVARAGKLTLAVSGPRAGFDRAQPFLEMLGRSVTYVGDGDAARLVKICHNLVLGVMAQAMAETTVLAERGGIKRSDYLAFLNDSVLGSTFSRYKTPALVNLDFTPTFTGHLLRKDLELGLEQGRRLQVPLPLTELTEQIVVDLIEQGLGDQDFASLVELEARAAGMTLKPENREVSDGLGQASSAEG